MILFYHKEIGKIFGTMNGFKAGNRMIKPSNVAEEMVGVKILTAEFENNNSEIIKDILSYRVENGELVK